MSLRVGVVGTGAIGTDHAHALARRVAGAEVTAVFDVDAARAEAVAAAIGATAYETAASLVESEVVDAVVVATPGETHAGLVLACLRAEKPVLCEKPLATTVADCLDVLEAETAVGRRLVQVGFMRRFDPGYLEVKRALDSGSIGTPLIVHCVHRNPSVPPAVTNEMMMSDSLIHELDVARWLLDDEIAAVSVASPKTSPLAAPGLQDPQLVLIEMVSGVLVEVEVFGNCRFGYDVRCEVVASEGIAELETPRLSALIGAGTRRESIPRSWQERFGETYRLELQAWIDAVRSGEAVGPSSWDGYAATAAAEAAVTAYRTRSRTPVPLVEQPALYRAERSGPTKA